MRIGFIGTGTMGTPIAGCLIAAGHRLTVYDKNPQAMGAADRATASRRSPTTPPRPPMPPRWCLPRCPDRAQVEAAVLTPDTGIFAGLRKGGAYIDLTTNAPATVRLVAEAARKRDVAFLDAPVSGRPPNMTVMVGGREADFGHCKPLFEAIAANVFYVGPSGAGATAKLVTQYLGYTGFIAALEGMLVAAKAGVDLDTLAKIVPVSAGQMRTFDNIPRGVFPGTFVSGGTLDIVAKDIELACQLARDVGAPAALGALASDVYKRAQAQGWGQEGFPVVARVLEAMAGVELRSGGKK